MQISNSITFKFTIRNENCNPIILWVNISAQDQNVYCFQGVTIPSQQRYVGYYATLVSQQLNYHPVTLLIKEIQMDPLPTVNGGQCSKFHISSHHSCKMI